MEPLESFSYQGGHYLDMDHAQQRRGYKIAKRIFDFSLSLVALICLLPFLVVIALCIKIESKGPVLFLQERVGQDKKLFRIYKFRSMCEDAASQHEKLKQEYGDTNISFKIKDDPRITKVGKFIRKLSIDELPQLLNILKGDMSIVGPRPLPTYEADQLTEEYNARFHLKPGLTCYWQVSGRSDISFDERMEMDLRYARECSFWLDVKLILKTIPAVLTSKGAY